LISEANRQAGNNFGLLYEAFWLYAVRNPAAREQLTRLEDENVRAIAQILESERSRNGIEPLESPERTARIMGVLFHGIGMLRVLQPDVVDNALETAISFVARGLGVEVAP
jgi:hypothetical protein